MRKPFMNRLLAAAFAGIISVGTVAAPVGAATISNATIDTSRKANMTIFKYDETAAQKGGVDTTQWMATGQVNADAAKKLEDYAVQGVEFTYVRVADIETYSEVGKNGKSDIQVMYGFDKTNANQLISALDLTDYTPVTVKGNMQYYNSDDVSDAIRDSLMEDRIATKNSLEDFVLSKGGTTMAETNEYGRTDARNLDLGLYLIAETAVPEFIVNTTDPFFVSLPMTDNDGDNWIYDVTVYPKNQSGNPTLEKTVTEVTTAKEIDYQPTATASDGDVVAYHVESTLPTITSKATYLKEYTFVDTLTKGIEYNQKDVVIEWFSDANCTNKIGTWTENDSTAMFKVSYGNAANDGTSMTVSMTEAGLDSINPEFSGCTMRISYACTVNSNADTVYGDAGNPNDVQLTWRRTNETYYDTLEDDCTVYVYGLDLLKQFSGDGTDYASVSFKVQNQSDNYYVVASGTDGIYYVTGLTKNESEATSFVPGNSGKLLIYGLEDDTYIATELTTAAGYTLLKDDIEIVITSTLSEDKESRTASAAVNGDPVTMEEVAGSANALAPLTVLNTKGFNLPQTGGEGSTALIILGMVLAAAGGTSAVLLSRKRAA